MNKLNITTIAAALSIVFSAGVMAQSMSKDAYKIAVDRTTADYTTEKASCDVLSGNTKDICLTTAKSKEQIAKADLEVRYEPTAKNRYQALVAKAEGDYAVANEKCDEKADIVFPMIIHS